MNNHRVIQRSMFYVVVIVIILLVLPTRSYDVIDETLFRVLLLASDTSAGSADTPPLPTLFC